VELSINRQRVMAIILPHGVLFRGDTVIGVPANL
jgi:type I restriction-modification system DNA methylase subunit